MRMTTPQILVCFVGFAEAIVYGYSFPYFSLALEARGLSSTLIGLNAMAGTLGAIVVGPFVPRLIARFGYRRFSIAALLIAALVFGAVSLHDGTMALFAYRLILGFALASLWISTEAWLNHVVEDRNRGFMNGFFQTCYSLGFFLGPNLAAIAGPSGSAGPVTAAIIALVGLAACLTLGRADANVDGDFEAPLDWRVAWNARGLLLIALLTGIAETAMYTLLPVFGLQLGFTHQVAIAILVIYTFGEVVLTLPLGWIADRADRRKMLALCALAGSASVAALGIFGLADLGAKVAAFVAGGMIVSLYNLALVIVGETYRGTDLPVVSTAFSMAYSIGCATGSTVGGAAIDLAGPYGLPGLVSVVLAVFGIAAYFAFARPVRLPPLAEPIALPPDAPA